MQRQPRADGYYGKVRRLPIFALALGFGGALLFPIHAQNLNLEQLSLENQDIAIEADFIGYAFDNNILTATGNVKTNIGRLWIQADSLQVDVKNLLLQAQGNVLLGSIPQDQLAKVKEAAGILDTREPLVEFKLRGDAAVVDLRNAQGSLYRVTKNVDVIYFYSEDLLPLGKSQPRLTEPIPIPDLDEQKIAMVAKRIRLRIGSRMEAWKVAFYHKGFSIIHLPYYTTAAADFVRNIPFHLRDLSYSSSTGVSSTLQWAYRPSQKSPGFIDFFFRQRASPNGKPLRANLQQHLAFSNNASLRLQVQDLFEKGRLYNLSVQNHLSAHDELQSFLSHGPGLPFQFSLLYLKQATRSSFNAQANIGRGVQGGTTRNLSFQFSIFPLPSGGVTPRLLYSSNFGVDAKRKGTFRQELSLDLIRAPFHLNRFTLMNARLSFRGDLSKISGQVQSGSSFNWANDFITRFSPSVEWLLGYRFGVQKTREESLPSTSLQQQSLVSRFTVKHGTTWNLDLQSTFSITENRLVSLVPSYDLSLSDRWRIRASSSYDPLSPIHFRVLNFALQYAFFGRGDSRVLQAFLVFDRELGRISEYSIGLPFLQ